MSQIHQAFYASSVSGTTVVLSPQDVVGEGLPPHLRLTQVTLRTANTVTAGEQVQFWSPVTSCVKYVLTLQRVTS